MRPNSVLRTGKILLIVWLCAAFAGPRSIVAESPYPVTPEMILEAQRIPITQKALFAALASRNADVRGAAAESALGRWPKDAIRPVEHAMLNETLIWNRIGMARALFTLGDPVGRETLVKVCHDTTVRGTARMEAAESLSRFKDDSCLDSVFNTLESATDKRNTDAKEQALELAPALINEFGQQYHQKVFQLVIKSLRDPDGNVRVTASTVLMFIGDPAAIPNLQVATAEEKDEDNRSWMIKSLRSLQSKNQARQQ